MKKLFQWIKQQFCQHQFDYKSLKPVDEWTNLPSDLKCIHCEKKNELREVRYKTIKLHEGNK